MVPMQQVAMPLLMVLQVLIGLMLMPLLLRHATVEVNRPTL